MAKVYVVYKMYHEHDDLGEDIYNSESICKVFDNEEKAISYIRENIKKDHGYADLHFLNDEHLTKYDPDIEDIRPWVPVMSYEYSCLTYMLESYRYEPHTVE